MKNMEAKCYISSFPFNKVFGITCGDELSHPESILSLPLIDHSTVNFHRKDVSQQYVLGLITNISKCHQLQLN